MSAVTVADDVLLERETLWVQRRGATAVIWLNRPDRLNAFTYAMRDDVIIPSTPPTRMIRSARW